MKRRVFLLTVSVSLVLCAACQQPSVRTTTQMAPTSPRGQSPQNAMPVFYDDIVWVSLMVDVPFLDADGNKTPDGVSVRVMLNRPGEKKYVAGRGAANIYLVQRVRLANGQFEDKQLKMWHVDEATFVRAVQRQRFGLVGHKMDLFWTGVRPEGANLYLRAEYIRPDQKHLWSRPVCIVIKPPTNPRF